jgi:hypothetical protein
MARTAEEIAAELAALPAFEQMVDLLADRTAVEWGCARDEVLRGVLRENTLRLLSASLAKNEEELERQLLWGSSFVSRVPLGILRTPGNALAFVDVPLAPGPDEASR